MTKQQVKQELLNAYHIVDVIQYKLEGDEQYQDQMYRHLEGVKDKIHETLICNGLW